MHSSTNLIIAVVAVVFLASCESGTGSSGAVAEEVIQLPESVVVVTEGLGVTQNWSEITEFEPQGDTLYISGVRRITRDGEPMQAEQTYHVCEIDTMVILPTYLVPDLLDCPEK